MIRYLDSDRRSAWIAPDRIAGARTFGKRVELIGRDGPLGDTDISITRLVGHGLTPLSSCVAVRLDALEGVTTRRVECGPTVHFARVGGVDLRISRRRWSGIRAAIGAQHDSR
jgi:hypothetical protein